MGTWYVLFTTDRSLSVETCEGLMTTIVGVPLKASIGELSGNPRDFYTREVTMSGARDNVKVSFRTAQGLRGEGDPEASILDANITLESASYAAKLEVWRDVQRVFTSAGCIDRTYESHPAPIVDDAVAAGDDETARILREKIAAQLVAQARNTRSVSIRSPRVDVEPILLAYQAPERIESFGLYDCGLRTLPAAFARFPNIETLSLEEDAFDGSILRGVSLPKLETLCLAGKSLRRLTKEDLAGFPSLELLNCTDSPLEELDANIIDVCPKLARVYVEHTPLAKNERAMAALRARWPHMRWSYWDAGPAVRAAPVEKPVAVFARATPPPSPPAPPVVVEKKEPPAPTFVDGFLDLSNVRELERVRALIATGDYRDATKLRIGYGNYGDTFAAFIATSRAFPKLVELELHASGISDVGTHALATTAVGLDALESISLGDAPGSRDAHFGGVTDAGAAALARSERLPALKTITRGFTHHVYAPGARDDRETTTFARADGSVVESIMYHSLWP